MQIEKKISSVRGHAMAQQAHDVEVPMGALSQTEASLGIAYDRAGAVLDRVRLIANELFGPAPESDDVSKGMVGSGGRLNAINDLVDNLNARLAMLDDQVSRLGQIN